MRSCRLLLELESAGPWLGGKVLERRCGLGGGGWGVHLRRRSGVYEGWRNEDVSKGIELV